MGHTASAVVFQSLIHFVNAITGHINGFGVDVEVGGRDRDGISQKGSLFTVGHFE